MSKEIVIKQKISPDIIVSEFKTTSNEYIALDEKSEDGVGLSMEKSSTSALISALRELTAPPKRLLESLTQEEKDTIDQILNTFDETNGVEAMKGMATITNYLNTLGIDVLAESRNELSKEKEEGK